MNTVITSPTSQKNVSSNEKQKTQERNRLHIHAVAIFMLLCACLGMSWFACQCFLVPQTVDFVPDWQGPSWIQAADGFSSVAYFRYVTDINATPDGAFVTIAANQVFRLSINGFAVGNNFHDFEQGYFPQTYMYNIATLIKPGPNVFAVVVSNFNKQRPMLRMSIGLVQGNAVHFTGTGTGGSQWKATMRSDIIYPHYSTAGFEWNVWTTSAFDSSSWQLATHVIDTPTPSMLTVNPLLYERPLANHWMSAGLTQEAYFVRHFSLSFGITQAWLRIVAIGNANVFINGHSVAVWNGQPILLAQNELHYLSDNTQPVQYRSGLDAGIYNITTSLHAGQNTIAVHVTAPLPAGGNAQTGLGSLNATMTLDVLVTDLQGNQMWLPTDSGWQASTIPANGWVQDSQATHSWSSPILVESPGPVGTLLAQNTLTTREVQVVPIARIVIVIIVCTALVFGLWLLFSLIVIRRYAFPRAKALDALSLAYLPALACESLLIVLAHETNILQPFPYTVVWLLILIVLIGAGYILLLFTMRDVSMRQRVGGDSTSGSWIRRRGRFITSVRPERSSTHGRDRAAPTKNYIIYGRAALLWLRANWVLVLIMAIAAPLIFYNLSYEPYWQDELTSYYAAKGILAHGIPVMPSGFLYPKGELYSYMLALSMAILGDGNGTPRLLSAVEYMCSLPLLYWIGSYFFGKRVALLATAMLAFSPMALLWGRQVRMYEQAQLCTLLSVYFIYKALEERHRVRYVYLAIVSLVVMYLSHEETFIVFPAIALWVLLLSRDERRRTLAVLYQKHWWIAGTSGASIILVQLLIVHFSHPPILGTDQSQTPFIQFTTINIPYYLKLLFAPWALGRVVAIPWIMLNSLLAVVGCIMALRGQDYKAKYCAWVLFSSFLTLMLVFTLSSDRYLYPILPVYYLMGAYALVRLLNGLWRFVRPHLLIPRETMVSNSTVGNTGFREHIEYTATTSRPVKMVMTLIVACFIASVIILPMLPANDYNPFVSQVLDLSYHRHYPDYDGVGQFMQQNWKKGDIVVAIFPAISVLYYVGHNDYFFSIDRALYLFEQNGEITDTPTGSRPLLNQSDFQSVLSTHARIWIISDNGSYQSQVQGRFTFPPDFHLVYQGYQSAIYLRGD